MTPEMWKGVEYYAAYALQGILANPNTYDMNTQKYWAAKNLTAEKMAILAGVEMVQKLAEFKQAQANIDARLAKKGPELVP